VKITDSP